MKDMAKGPLVGLPRALLHYEYGHVWRDFLAYLGARTLVSRPTSRAVVDRGVRAAIDEACLPVKVAYGHCLELADQGVDLLWVPRVVSVEHRAYSCPKLLGLPDMIRLAVPQCVGVLAPRVDISRGGTGSLRRIAAETGATLCSSPAEIRQAGQLLQRELPRAVHDRLMMAPGPERDVELGCGGGGGPAPVVPHGAGAAAGCVAAARLRIGLVGHSYNIYDGGINLGMQDRLRRMGAELITPEDYLPAQLEAAAGKALAKPLFWTLGRRLAAAAHLMADDPSVGGIIAIESFGCGPDSMVVDLCMRLVGWRRPELPFMELTLDEHTGEAGFVTRLEAFVDLAARRRTG